MALKAVVASLDTVTEAFHGEYTKGDDGRFYLAVDGVDDMPAVAGLKKKNGELLTEKKQVQDKLEAYTAFGTPEEIAELKKHKGTGKDAEKIAELEQKLAGAAQQAQREVQAAKEEAAKAAAAAQEYFLESELTSAIRGAKGEPALLMAEARRHVRAKQLDSTDGKPRFALEVLKDGQPRIKDSAGNAFGATDLVEELKANPVFGRAFEPSGASGSGAPPLGGGGGGATKTIAANDPIAFGQNLEGIAKGTVTVAQ